MGLKKVALCLTGDVRNDMAGFSYVYESFLTQIPMVVHCELENNKLCDPIMLEKLNADSKRQNEKETDPRWDVLKKLIDKK